ncbi:hypothetical protein PUG46_18090 [Erwiniaceae bacterium L1_55_4]|nr:hypothetical protein [Erwiniaceae bacterium L1_55_4]
MFTKNARCWHPAHSLAELLAGLTGNMRKSTWLTKLKVSQFK